MYKLTDFGGVTSDFDTDTGISQNRTPAISVFQGLE